MSEQTTEKITKILIANRGEIAVRVIRAAKDAGIPSVAVYADPDANAPFVTMADEAFALGGQTSAESYLVFDKILDAAKKSGANAIHPGYGFLSENAEFAQAVLDAAGVDTSGGEDDREIERFREFLDSVEPEDFEAGEPPGPSP